MSLEISAETSFALDLTNTTDIYNSQYQPVYNAMTNKPTSSIAAAQNTMVESLVSGGVWAKLDVLQVYAQYSNDDGEALINWISPGTYNATLVNSPTFTSLEGFAGNGTSSYINTGFIPNIHGTNFIQDSASAGFYCRTNSALTAKYEMGTTGAGSLGYIIITGRTSTVAQVRINCTTETSAAHSDSSGMFIANRLNSTDNDLYHNKIKIINGSEASNGLSPVALYACCINNNGSAAFYSERQISILFAGAGMTQTDVDVLTDAIEIYMDSNSKGVIS